MNIPRGFLKMLLVGFLQANTMFGKDLMSPFNIVFLKKKQFRLAIKKIILTPFFWAFIFMSLTPRKNQNKSV